MSDLVERSNQSLNSFTGYEDLVEGEEEQQIGALIQGTKIKFTNTAMWMANGDEELPADLKLVVVEILRVVQKWGPDGKPIEEHTRILAPGEKWPDVAALNEACPRSEWREFRGQMFGPWQAQRIVYFVDLFATMAKYTWPTATIGGRIAINDLVDRTKWAQKFHGAPLYPIVTLSDIPMNTRYGERQRPHFIVQKQWMSFRPNGEMQQVELMAKKQLDAFAAEESGGVKLIDPPTAKQVTGDEVRF
jgi:hypothetical protein